MTALVLRLPWPPKDLSPNARPHWAVKQRVTREYRWECFAAAREHFWPQRDRPMGAVTAKVVFVVPTRHRRDLDNAMASIKTAFDALVSVGHLVDDDSKHLKLAAPEMRVQRGEKFVEITLT